MKYLELEPGSINVNRLGFSRGPEGAVGGEFGWKLRDTLGALLVQPVFDPEGVPDAFVDAIDEYAPQAITDRLQYEAKRHFQDEDFAPLTVKLTNLSLLDEARAGNVALSPDFIQNLKTQVQNISPIFEPLQRYHDSFSGNRSLSLVHDVWRLSQDKPDGWFDEIYDLVGSAVHNSEFTPAVGDPESLYLITFMPHLARQLTRRALIHNHMAARIADDLGEAPDDGNAAMFDVYLQYTTADALSGQHWRQPANHFGWSSEHAIEMGLISAQSIVALGAFERLVGPGKGKDFITAWKTTRDNLRSVIESVAHDYRRADRLSDWQLQDIGHCFHGFNDYDLARLFGESDLSRREYNPTQKTSGKAVILEDDDKQMAVWQQVLDAHSTYTVSDATSLATPDGIEHFFDDREVGLFLLDIQNGEDATAGIRVADELIRRRIATMEATADHENLRELTVVVWSSSHEAIEAAHEHFSKYDWRGSMKHPLVAYTGIGGGSSGKLLNIEVKDKDLNYARFVTR